MSLDPNYSVCWLQLIVFSLQQGTYIPSPLNMILDTRNFMLGDIFYKYSSLVLWNVVIFLEIYF